MNIRVDLNTPIRDGMEVVFRSPVDCSQITGLIVYFSENGKTASKEFMLADAHGNNVGDIDHLFAEDVVVKVILDVGKNMAFVQNADTNAYLEGRFAELPITIMDKLCPPFENTGTLVQCEPMEGTDIVISAGNIPDTYNITVCGKNLYDKDVYPLKIAGYSYSGNSNQGIFSASDTYRRTDFIPVSHLRGQTIVLNHPPSDYGTVSNPGMSFYTSIPDVGDNAVCKAAWCGGTIGGSIKVPDNAEYMVFCVRKQDAPEGSTPKDIQIEVGSVASSYEDYKVHGTGALTDSDDVVVVKAGCGIHTIYANGVIVRTDMPEITVSGKADPVAIIDKLTNAIISLGGNV